MSINMDMADESTDYSDFRYQQIAAEISFAGAETAENDNDKGQISFSPLQARAGLDVNEVAELVGYRIQIGMEFEEETSSAQTLYTSSEIRGVFGANLDSSGSQFPQEAVAPKDTEVIRAEGTADPILEGGTLSDDNIFEMFRATGSPGFDDGAGAGGGGYATTTTYDRSYRDLTGRGPVLDSNDSLDVNMALNRSNSNVQERGIFRAHLIWDVAEVDDAGRAFSVPM